MFGAWANQVVSRGKREAEMDINMLVFRGLCLILVTYVPDSSSLQWQCEWWPPKEPAGEFCRVRSPPAARASLSETLFAGGSGILVTDRLESNTVYMLKLNFNADINIWVLAVTLLIISKEDTSLISHVSA